MSSDSFDRLEQTINSRCCRGGFAARALEVSSRFSGVLIRGEPPNNKTTRERDKTMLASPDFTNEYQTNPPSPTNKGRLLVGLERLF